MAVRYAVGLVYSMFKAKSFLFKCYPEVLLTWIYYWKNPALPPRSPHDGNVDRVEEITQVEK